MPSGGGAKASGVALEAGKCISNALLFTLNKFSERLVWGEFKSMNLL